MTESSHNAILLKKSNEQRFNQIWNGFAKPELNAMKISQFFQLVIERCLVNNRTTLCLFYDIFNLSTQRRTEKEALNPPASNLPPQERLIRKEQFVFLLNELGKRVYHNDKNHQDRVYNDLLGEKTIANKDMMHTARVMNMDQPNRKMLQQNAIKTLISFEAELKNIYLIYVDENYWSLKKKGRILLTQREVELQNKRMTTVSFIRFLKEAEVVPHLTSVEQVEDTLCRVVPSTNILETQFYYKHFLVDSYSKDLDNPALRSDGDPGMLLFEFMVALARLAVETSREMDNQKKVYDLVIAKFLTNYLCIRTNEEVEQKKPLQPVKKQFHHNLRRFYELSEGEIDHHDLDSEEEVPINQLDLLKQKEQQILHLEPLKINIPAILQVLEAQLPALPANLAVKQELPPPYPPKFKELDKIVIGQPLPPEKEDKNKSSQKPASKKTNLKKGEKPPRVFQFLSPSDQTKKVLTSEDYLQKLASQLDYSLKPLSSLDRGDIPLDPFPSIIAEILYPPEIHEDILPYIEAGLNAHNDGLFSLALQNYDKAQRHWRAKGPLSPSLELYFEFTRGGVFISAGRDDYAFNYFYRCKAISDKMPYLNPDRALSYCGLGEALYNAQEYQLSCRAYLKARQIREALMGLESVDTATVFNNLGCCFFMLDRNKEALSYFKVGLAVMIAQLGEFHERSQSARENINLCNKSFYKNMPEYRKLWEVYELDRFGKKKKKVKKDKKK